MNDKIPAIHPGEILREEYLTPAGMTADCLAQYVHVPTHHIERLIAGEAPVTVDIALRLARFFNTTSQFWLNMQVIYDLKNISAEVQSEIATIHAYEMAQ